MWVENDINAAHAQFPDELSHAGNHAIGGVTI